MNELDIAVTAGLDSTNVDISISRLWLGFAAIFLMFVAIPRGPLLPSAAIFGVLALSRIRISVSATKPLVSRGFSIAGITIFRQSFQISRRARLRFTQKQQQFVLQLDLVDKVLTILQSRNEQLVDRAAAALKAPLSKWTGDYTIV